MRRSLDAGVACGEDMATVWVANASLSTATPHAGQKRLLPAISLAQELHRAIHVVYAATVKGVRRFSSRGKALLSRYAEFAARTATIKISVVGQFDLWGGQSWPQPPF